MSRRIDIIGTGVGPGTLTLEAREAIAQADILVGSSRLIREYAHEGQQTAEVSRPDQVLAVLRGANRGTEALPTPIRAPQNPDGARIGDSQLPQPRFAPRQGTTAVLMSGDVGFHSGASAVYAGLQEEESRDVRLIPGVSAPVAFAARLGIPWEDAHLVSCHIPGHNLTSSVRRHFRTIALTGGNVPALAQDLIDAGYTDLQTWAGEDLGLSQERITRTTIADLLNRQWSPLTILMIENPDWDAKVRSGISDEEFTRSDIPMTKSEIRAYALSRLALKPTDVCWDIGCGTGSVTVEMALATYDGGVWAVDSNSAAAELTRTNCRRFHIGNVTVCEGSAPEALADWPIPDAVFIGGTSGAMDSIVGHALARNPHARIVVTAIAVESVAAAIAALRTHGIDPDLTQLTVARSRTAGGLHLLMGLNPVTVITGQPHLHLGNGET